MRYASVRPGPVDDVAVRALDDRGCGHALVIRREWPSFVVLERPPEDWIDNVANSNYDELMRPLEGKSPVVGVIATAELHRLHEHGTELSLDNPEMKCRTARLEEDFASNRAGVDADYTSLGIYVSNGWGCPIDEVFLLLGERGYCLVVTPTTDWHGGSQDISHWSYSILDLEDLNKPPVLCALYEMFHALEQSVSRLLRHDRPDVRVQRLGLRELLSRLQGNERLLGLVGFTGAVPHLWERMVNLRNRLMHPASHPVLRSREDLVHCGRMIAIILTLIERVEQQLGLGS